MKKRKLYRKAIFRHYEQGDKCVSKKEKANKEVMAGGSGRK